MSSILNGLSDTHSEDKIEGVTEAGVQTPHLLISSLLRLMIPNGKKACLRLRFY
jgi:hypothetical protein